MPYTKKGPFIDGSSTPPINAAFLNDVETFLTTITPATNPTANTRNTVTGWFHADQYGAKGDGVTDDHAAIQNAINAANTAYKSTGARQGVYLPAWTYLIGADSYYNTAGATDGSAVSLYLLDGVDLFGPGTLKVKASAYGDGAHYAAIRSASTGVSHASIRGITIDGNRTHNTANTTQASNIELAAVADVEVSGTHQLEARGVGIQIYGVGSTQATDVRINNNDVLGVDSIGIQAGHINGLEIDGNTVGNCANNCIDIYGENGTTTADCVNFRISNNRVHHGLSGIFPETVAYGLVEGNVAWSCTESGIHINRVNGQPRDIAVTGNLITNCPNGIFVTGDMGSIYIRNNTIADVTTAGIQMGGGNSTSSHVYIADNFIDSQTINSIPLVLVATGTNVWTNATIRRTMTQNTTRSYDVVNYATTTTGSVSFDAANS